jgi:tetratricopeptide (TPR) repeat protein
MTLDNFINQAWSDHATDSQAVAERLQQGLSLITENSQIPGVVQLATHVFGEHLGLWNDGIRFLEGLKKLSVFQPNTDSQAAVERSVATLKLAGKISSDLSSFGTTEQIRIYSSAAAALCGQNQVSQASEYFKRALELAQTGLAKNDPANRALAVTGNNLAATLEEKSSRSAEENQLMILAALTGRKFWEIAGTWLNVERAEYRLCMSYLKAGQLPQALEHAQLCLEVIEQNKAEPMEYFFGYEALALVEKARSNGIGFEKAVEHAKKYFELIENEGNKKWCKNSLEKLVAGK